MLQIKVIKAKIMNMKKSVFPISMVNPPIPFALINRTLRPIIKNANAALAI